jgi:N-acetylmuramoyl-L-alanine amidase
VIAVATALALLAPPAIHQWRIPFPRARRSQMAAYARRHYGIDSFELKQPKVIVEHIAVAPTATSIRNAFAVNRRDPEHGELPNVCTHFAIGRDGAIHQLVSVKLMCRHTVGLNYTAIGIEHAGYSDGDLLSNRRQLRASLRLTAWLRCRHGIALRDVIGHNESVRSPYHRERVAHMKRQTHGDMRRASMLRYRRELRRIRC